MMLLICTVLNNSDKHDYLHGVCLSVEYIQT